MSDCPSNIHETPVAGTVHGMYAHWDGTRRQPVTYCAMCAATGKALGLFRPSTEDPEGLALVQAIHDRKAGGCAEDLET